MSTFFKKSIISAAVIVAISLAGCARFDERMQASGDFDYQDVQLVSAYQTGTFSTDGARAQFTLPVLTESQKASGFLAQDVDIRPPTQLIPVIDGVFLTSSKKIQTQILFNTLEQGTDIKAKVWQLLKSYLAKNKIDIISEDSALLQIETAVHPQENIYSTLFSSNEVLREASYRFKLEDQSAGSSNALLNVELLSYAEFNDDKALEFSLTDKRKQNVELAFVNDLLAFAYYEKQANELKNKDVQPLPIKLGFDEHHQTVWIVESSFEDTWRKLPALLTLLNFEILETDQNLGTLALEYSTPDDEYWQENNLNPFEIKYGDYFIQLGEMDGKRTTISWLNKDKKPLEAQKVTDIYLGITKQVRGVLLQQDKQTKTL